MEVPLLLNILTIIFGAIFGLDIAIIEDYGKWNNIGRPCLGRGLGYNLSFIKKRS